MMKGKGNVRHPERKAQIPNNIDNIKAGCINMGKAGYFASVSVANADDPFDPMANKNGNYLSLYRGHGMLVRYQELQQV